MLHFLISYGSLLLVCGYAGWRGGWPERWAAALLIIGVAATTVVYIVGENAYLHLDKAIFAIDGLFLAAMLWITVKADRYWTIPFTAMHLMTVGGHIVRLVGADVPPLMYRVMISGPIYPMLLILAIGTARAASRRAARQQRSYRTFFPNMALLTQKTSRIF